MIRRWGVGERLFAAVLLCTLAGTLGSAPVAHANTITVTSKLDTIGSPGCMLRDAIIAANTNAASGGCTTGTLGLDTITFSLGNTCLVTQCTIQLTSALPDVTQDLTINGGSFTPAISGANLYRIFFLGAVVVNFSNLRLTNGRSHIGAAIYMDGTTLTLTNVRIAGNHADYNAIVTAVEGPNSPTADGGGIYQSSGTLYVFNSSFLGNDVKAFGAGKGGALRLLGGITVISNTTFSNNTADLFGGAIAAGGNLELSVSSSVFDGNSADRTGGAIMAQSDTNHVSISGSTFTNNQVLTPSVGFGGGAISDSNAALTMANSTLANNRSGGAAGGLWVEGAAITLTNVTLSGNSATGAGGGIYALSDTFSNQPASVLLNNVTLTNNTADSDNNNDGDGGGLSNVDGTVTVWNSLIASNFDTPNNAGGGTKHPDCSGIYASPKYSLIGRNDGCVGFVNGSNGNLVGTAANPIAPLLGLLTTNGGTTMTHALLPGSPARDAANPALPGSGGFACIATDQRGILRPKGPRCDMGAFEAEPPLYLPLITR